MLPLPWVAHVFGGNADPDSTAARSLYDLLCTLPLSIGTQEPVHLLPVRRVLRDHDVSGPLCRRKA